MSTYVGKSILQMVMMKEKEDTEILVLHLTHIITLLVVLQTLVAVMNLAPKT